MNYTPQKTFSTSRASWSKTAFQSEFTPISQTEMQHSLNATQIKRPEPQKCHQECKPSPFADRALEGQLPGAEPGERAGGDPC